MPNVTIPNFPAPTNTDMWTSMWKLTRALKHAGWIYKASSDSVAATKDTTANPANDKWGAGTQFGSQTATASFTIGTPNTTAKGGRVTISGLTGFVSTSVGRYLTITGATNSSNNGTWLITKFNSSSSIDVENPAAIAETTPGSATWTEITFTAESISANLVGANGVGSWWCAEGPSTMRIPIGSTLPTGTFIRGENVVQSTTGATGEFLGLMPDPAGGTGYLVIVPRVSGTGAAPRGWDAVNTITGSTSGATCTPTSTPIEYIREIVLWKASISAGHVYTQVIDSVNESTPSSINGRFSLLAALAQCTSSICPGGASGAPTVNGFPTTGTRAVLGTGGSNSAVSGFSGGVFNTSFVNAGSAQIMCANNISDVNVSQDGSFVLALGTPASSSTTFVGFSFQRCDDTEEGDVDPYVFFVYGANGGGNNYDTPRTSNTSSANTANMFSGVNMASSNSLYRGWRRRGFATEDRYQDFYGTCLAFPTLPVLLANVATVERVATAITTTTVREPIWIISTEVGRRMRKGTLRWMFLVPGGVGCDTYDTRRWVQLSSGTGGDLGVVAGPYDGTSTPTNA